MSMYFSNAQSGNGKTAATDESNMRRSPRRAMGFALEWIIVIRMFAATPKDKPPNQIHRHEQRSPTFVLTDMDHLMRPASVEVALRATQNHVTKSGRRRTGDEGEISEEQREETTPELHDPPTTAHFSAREKPNDSNSRSPKTPRDRPENLGQ